MRRTHTVAESCQLSERCGLQEVAGAGWPVESDPKRRSAFRAGSIREVLAQRCPPQQLIERGAERLTPISQTVFDFGRHLVMDDSANDAVFLQLAQLLDQHLLRDRGNGSLKLRETQQLAVEQVEQDDELPAPFENLERLFHPLGSRGGRVAAVLTVR
jgi:hypothetical protein